ncbi:MAG: hypothetical protein A2103_04595 [Gammaproteobacteria bacterium GWF2_41_13]|nr:MAG: hypothetical protein A2103_04595 [Gammaproteobacteria bacterium GWF2_41_13]
MDFAGHFISSLVKLCFDLAILLFVLRILIQRVDIDVLNPVAQTIMRWTQKPLRFLQKIPHIAQLDTPAILFVFLLNFVKIILITISVGKFPSLIGLIIWTIGDLFSQLLTLYFYLILIGALLSWFVPVHQTPIIFVIHKITNPLFSRARKIIPLIGNIDFSPIVILLLLQLISSLLISPIIQLGVTLALR